MQGALSDGRSVTALLNPAPPSFRRAPAVHLTYEPFSPAALASLHGDLSKGFPQLVPETRAAPHPFATHDVCEDDWLDDEISSLS